MIIELLYNNLYNNSMINLSDIFTSKARVKILRILFCHSQFLSLRHISNLSQMPVFSIQRALAQLVDEKILVRKKIKNAKLYSLNRNHQAYELLVQVFNVETKNKIMFRSYQYKHKARSVLDFVSSFLPLPKVIKK